MSENTKKSISYTGTVVWVGELDTRTGKTGHVFTKREFVITPDPGEDRPTMLLLTLKKGQKEDRTTLVTEGSKGMRCTVEYFPDVRFWEDPASGKKRAFGENACWKVVYEDGETKAEVEGGQTKEAPYSCSDDDMPF